MQKQSVRDVIKQRRIEKGLSAEKLGELVGVAKTTIYRYESGDIAKMPVQVATKMSDVLGINPLFFVNMSDGPDSSNISITQKIVPVIDELVTPRQQRVYDFATNQLSQQRAESDQVSEKVVPLHPVNEVAEREIVTGRATAAGAPINGDDQDVGAVSTLIRVDDIPRGADEIVTVDGDSMEPDFHRGQQIYLHYQETVENGELAIVRVEDEGVTFKQIYIDDSDCSITLHSLNSDYQDRVFEPDQVSIIGRIID